MSNLQTIATETKKGVGLNAIGWRGGDRAKNAVDAV
jgi:hypothetical protein